MTTIVKHLNTNYNVDPQFHLVYDYIKKSTVGGSSTGRTCAWVVSPSRVDIQCKSNENIYNAMCFYSSYSEMYSMSIFILCYCHFYLGDSSDRGSVEAIETV